MFRLFESISEPSSEPWKSDTANTNEKFAGRFELHLQVSILPLLLLSYRVNGVSGEAYSLTWLVGLPCLNKSPIDSIAQALKDLVMLNQTVVFSSTKLA